MYLSLRFGLAGCQDSKMLWPTTGQKGRALCCSMQWNWTRCSVAGESGQPCTVPALLASHCPKPFSSPSNLSLSSPPESTPSPRALTCLTNSTKDPALAHHCAGDHRPLKTLACCHGALFAQTQECTLHLRPRLPILPIFGS